MTPAEVYENYLALKLHFTTDSYDVFKYNWKTKSANYTGRKDKLQFERLARHADPIGLMVSNFIVDPGLWIGSIFDPKHQSVYSEWKRRRDTLSYIFSEEIKSLTSDSFKVIDDDQHPELLKLYLRKKVSPETMVILNHYVGYSAVWDRKLANDVIWKDVSRLIHKYTGFVKFDHEKTHKIMLDTFINP